MDMSDEATAAYNEDYGSLEQPQIIIYDPTLN
jgi:hypothetical protein